MTRLSVGYAGMTHLGLNSAAAAAERGFPVICFDPDTAVIAALKSGALPVVEPGLQDTVARNSGRLRFSQDASELAACDVVYVAPDVPTNDRGESDLSDLRTMIEQVTAVLNPQATLVIHSQVPPGFCRGIAHDPARTFYQVETLIFGRAVERALKPERFIVGSARRNQALPELYRSLLEAYDCPILMMSYESAELTKIAINMFLVSSVSTTNTIAEICERIGADWADIAPALRLDRRIGEHAYLSPGLGIAGGNLERDLATIVAVGDAHGADVGVVRAWRENSRHRRDWTLRAIHASGVMSNKLPVFGVLGLAYKEGTHSTKNSPALDVLSALESYEVKAFDPAVACSASQHPHLVQAESALAACDDVDALVVMTPWPEFRSLDVRKIAARMRGRITIDPFACLNDVDCHAAGLRHFVLGSGTSLQQS